MTVDLPEAPPPVKAMTVQELKEKVDGGEDLLVIDVRNPQERAQASLDFATPLDSGGMEALGMRDKDLPVAFLCHHGRSSLAAAEHFRKEGFTSLWNILGGIDTWSREIDPEVPQY